LYEKYWGLKEKPFENTPDPRLLFHTDDSSGFYARLLYTLKGNRGAALLTGPAGSGKTLTVRTLLQQFDTSAEVALLTQPCANGAEFLTEVLYQLGAEDPPTQRQEAVHCLQEILYNNHAAGKQNLVVIDGAHLLTGQEVFAEMQLLLDYQLNDAFLVTLLLSGHPPLTEQVQAFASLDQSIACRAYLRPFRPEETQHYIAHRLKVAGRDEAIFDADAVEGLHAYAAGFPRKINNICDIALVIGFSRKLEKIDGEWMRDLIRTEQGNGA
jgi:general secretion pathway protein A